MHTEYCSTDCLHSSSLVPDFSNPQPSLELNFIASFNFNGYNTTKRANIALRIDYTSIMIFICTVGINDFLHFSRCFMCNFYIQMVGFVFYCTFLDVFHSFY